jgi:hypothetical protein
MPRVGLRAPGWAVALAMLATLAATGCSTGSQAPSHAPIGSGSPLVNLTAAAPVPRTATVGDPNGVLVPAPAPPPPRCRPLVHYSAGNAGPLFCTDGADNPAALRYFSGLHLKIMRLPASANQAQAVTAICADLAHVSEAAEYSAYLLAANREPWYFTGIAKVHGALRRLCHPSSEPSSAPTAPR